MVKLMGFWGGVGGCGTLKPCLVTKHKGGGLFSPTHRKVRDGWGTRRMPSCGDLLTFIQAADEFCLAARVTDTLEGGFAYIEG